MDQGSIESIAGEAPVTVNATNGAVVNLTFTIKQDRKASDGRMFAPTMEALKELMDAVIATTKSEAEAARLEICRAYLFNPRLAGKLEKQMLTQIGKQAVHPQ